MGRRSLALVVALAASPFAATTAHADDDAPLRGVRVGFVPTLGVGVAQFTGQRPYFPSFIGMSVSQLEFIVDTGRWGGFLRGAFLSSGADGRWTAPVVALGPTYRFAGDGETRWGIVGKAGLVYQRWHANTAGCAVPFFFPDNCKDFADQEPPGTIVVVAPNYSTTVDNLGLMGGASFEIPVESFYLALGAELAATADIDHATPGLAFAGQLTFSFALRDHVHQSVGTGAPELRHRFR